MRRLRDRPADKLFRGSELPRLLTMVIMLGVLAMLISMARDANTWRWLVPEQPHEQAAGADPGSPAPAGGSDAVTAAEPNSPGPTHQDPQEQDAVREEFQAMADREPLRPQEMPAYWRLMAWERHQSTDQLLARAARDVSYNDLWQQPDKWRGKLVELRVHLQRALKVDELAANPLDMKSLYEVCGWTSASWNWYWMVVPDLPPGMPTGENLYQEATFVGYFLKLQPYEDRQGKARAMPLLIGRLIWHPTATSPPAGAGNWTWTWYLAAALGVLIVVRWTLALTGRAANRRAAASRSDPERVDAWLDDAERLGDEDEGTAEDDFDDEPLRTNGFPPWEVPGPAPPEE